MRTDERYLILLMLGIVAFTMLLSLHTATTAFAQNAPYGEEYMQQHDGEEGRIFTGNGTQ